MLSKNIHASPALCSWEKLHTQGFTKHNSSKWNSTVFPHRLPNPFLPQMRDLLFRLIKIRTLLPELFKNAKFPSRLHGEGKSRKDVVFFYNVTIKARLSTLGVKGRVLAYEMAFQNTELIRRDSKLSKCPTVELDYEVQGKHRVNQHFKARLEL